VTSAQATQQLLSAIAGLIGFAASQEQVLLETGLDDEPATDESSRVFFAFRHHCRR
jgi:hypothetical protein